MSVKTFVITLPKPLPPGARVKGVVTPEMLSELESKAMKVDVSDDCISFVKEEPDQVIEVNEEERENQKPVRKRQRLDHLTYEEKLMRRKLKNRVAAQTARDRKKIRMEELEEQVGNLTKQIKEMTNLVEMLTEQNTRLEDHNKILDERISQCTCKTVSVQKRSLNKSSSLVSDKAPVCGVTEKSAALPQPRAVTPQAAFRALFLTFLCSQRGQSPKDILMQSEEDVRELVQTLKESEEARSEFPSKETSVKWKMPHQPPWLLASPITP